MSEATVQYTTATTVDPLTITCDKCGAVIGKWERELCPDGVVHDIIRTNDGIPLLSMHGWCKTKGCRRMIHLVSNDRAFARIMARMVEREGRE